MKFDIQAEQLLYSKLFEEVHVGKTSFQTRLIIEKKTVSMTSVSLAVTF